MKANLKNFFFLISRLLKHFYEVKSLVMVLKHLKKKKKIRLKRKSQNSHDLIFALLALASWMDFSKERRQYLHFLS